LAAESPSEEAAYYEEARVFLRDLLVGGPVPAREVLALAKKAGISERTLRRAKGQENVEARRLGYGTRGEWSWNLPAKAI
jgi:hypothetical protein